MKQFFDTIIFGAALAAGIISVFQNVPFLVFAKRVGATFLIFYLVGVTMNVLWNAISAYVPGAGIRRERSAEEQAEN